MSCLNSAQEAEKSPESQWKGKQAACSRRERRALSRPEARVWWVEVMEVAHSKNVQKSSRPKNKEDRPCRLTNQVGCPNSRLVFCALHFRTQFVHVLRNCSKNLQAKSFFIHLSTPPFLNIDKKEHLWPISKACSSRLSQEKPVDTVVWTNCKNYRGTHLIFEPLCSLGHPER